MPGVTSGTGDGASVSGAGALVPLSAEARSLSVYPLHHGLKPPLARIAISWARGNALRVSFFRQPSGDDSNGAAEVGGKVIEVKLSDGDGDIGDAQFRKIAYGSVSPFALLQSRRNSLATMSKISSPYHFEWWEYVMEYSRDIKALLGNPKSLASPLIDDPKTVLKNVEEPTSLRAAWELMEIFYADKQSQSWLPERLVDWLADYDCLLSSTQATIHSKLVDFQKELVTLQVIEDNPKYWEVISSALAVGWLDIVVKMLRLHGSYQLDQINNREINVGHLMVLFNHVYDLCPEVSDDTATIGFFFFPLLTYLISVLHVIKQTENGLVEAVAVLISKMPRLRPDLESGRLESMYNVAQKCIQFKSMSGSHGLLGLIIGILGENTEVVLAECSREFGPWMVAHAIELLTAESDQAETLLREEHDNLGGISIEELHRLVYAQVLSSHSLTWQIAPIYLASCIKQGMGLLEILLSKQPVQNNQVLLKIIEICRLYELDSVSSNIMKIAGVYHWKHGRKGSGVFWLQQARDEVCLNRIAQQLFDSVGKSISDESFKQWEGLIELLGSESKTAGGLEFLHKYRDFKKSLKQVNDGKTNDAARQAVESLISLMKNPSTPQRFWLPLLFDSLKLLSWQERPLLNVSQTNLLLNKLQELSMARLRPDFIEADLPNQALSSVRLALATNLGRAILEE
ncbi:nuclear pore complex protein nup85 [Quercus suber]|uniref:Nuclear pore complex protein Nup85 n=1 Tax=Quercus suber TaxID=58331 RepID=A0AAW0KZM6_QUESU